MIFRYVNIDQVFGSNRLFHTSVVVLRGALSNLFAPILVSFVLLMPLNSPGFVVTVCSTWLSWNKLILRLVVMNLARLILSVFKPTIMLMVVVVGLVYSGMVDSFKPLLSIIVLTVLNLLL